MAFPDIRHRAGYLFLVVSVGHIILISAQVNTRAGIPLLESIVFGGVAGIQGALAGILGGVANGWRSYVALRGVHFENEALKHENAQLRVRLQEERIRSEKSRRLERLLGLRDTTPLSITAAEVIAGSASPDFRTVTIDKGTDDGVRRDMAVLAAEGVVGRVVVASGGAAKVQLLVDRNAAAGALLARSRTQGIVEGAGDGSLRLEYLPSTADVEEGDFVLTSGNDGIYPKGFVIGQVALVERSGGSPARVLVRPTVDFPSLEEVLVVLAPAPPDANSLTTAGREGGVR